MNSASVRRRSDLHPKILFLAHEASLTGAPMMLLHLLRWVRANTNIEFEIALKDDGALKGQYAALAPTFVLAPRLGVRLLLNCAKTGIRQSLRNSYERRRLAEIRARASPDLIYANTAAVVENVRSLSMSRSPLLWHIHEMSFVLGLDAFAGFPAAATRASKIIAASDPVRTHLVNADIPAEKIEVVHEFVPAPFFTSAEVLKHRNETRATLSFPKDAFVIGMCGTLDWRKGADLFPQIAKRALASNPNADLRFVWIGGAHPSAARQFQHDVGLLGLSERVVCTGTRDDSVRYMCALDALALTSREDPFPLAMLEAASLGIPVIAFAGAGGAAELIEDDAGLIVDYLDLNAMSHALLALADDNALRHRLGERARLKILERFTTEKQAPKIWQLINAVATESICRPA